MRCYRLNQISIVLDFAFRFIYTLAMSPVVISLTSCVVISSISTRILARIESATYDEEIKRHINELALDLGKQFFDLFQIQSLVRDVSSLRRDKQMSRPLKRPEPTRLTSVPFDGCR